MKRRGAATVEFAIVAPILFLLVFGMIEYGRALQVKQVLTNTAREGARHFADEGATAEDAEETVAVYLAKCGIDAYEVEFSPHDPVTGTAVTCTVWVSFRDVAYVAPFFYDDDILAEATMRRE
jgi:Flp pilus assembly protein TadG